MSELAGIWGPEESNRKKCETGSAWKRLINTSYPCQLAWVICDCEPVTYHFIRLVPSFLPAVQKWPWNGEQILGRWNTQKFKKTSEGAFWSHAWWLAREIPQVRGLITQEPLFWGSFCSHISPQQWFIKRAHEVLVCYAHTQLWNS